MHWDSFYYSKTRPWLQGPRGAGSGRVGAGSGRVGGGGVGLGARQSGAEWKPSRAE